LTAHTPIVVRAAGTPTGRSRTCLLIDRTVPLVDRLIRMSRLPVLRSTLADIVSLVDDLRP